MPAKGHEVTRIITAAEYLGDYMINGAIFTRSGLTTVGTDVVGFRPYFFSPILIGEHYTNASHLVCPKPIYNNFILGYGISHNLSDTVLYLIYVLPSLSTCVPSFKLTAGIILTFFKSNVADVAGLTSIFWGVLFSGELAVFIRSSAVCIISLFAIMFTS